MKFGIPRGLYYEPFLTEWKVFLEELGHSVEISPLTNKNILDIGVKEGVNEACISLKLTIGHSIYLREKVDLIFSPRLMNLDKWRRVTLCPKFRGLPDIIRVSVPRVFSVNAYLGTFWRKLDFYLKVGRDLGHSFFSILKAYKKAAMASKTVSKLMKIGFWPDEARELVLKDACLRESVNGRRKENTNGSYVGVVGYPYLIYDDYVSHSLIKRLNKIGFNVITPEMLDEKEIEGFLKTLFKPLFWSQSNKVLGAAFALLKKPEIEGIIHISSFSCGTDAWVGRLIELEARRVGKPLMRIVVDEHTAEAGLLTRLEAFTDLVRWRRGRAVI
ncbi:MAG: acyl-CoA dehydratase activase-related protein [Synergistetes bacterium]|nr:acyl-CoA dehydratase activase-related protein [Synergistota bacterium]MCX8127833.1 acyl-CoA dehydratase activase-related protein [Synergistota bacterium]MDW8192095.1 acyl-CoA dehydratase activase-related protein [Synergistota bacterium]